ncbi:hypothetical protein [Streptomyces sp. x-80]|jgi:hypothetical protein|uniref:hypothetical protein n=1 Tax=Streptomyces sp. x-80 TaxID=2789282 RepID=UPI0039814ED5
MKQGTIRILGAAVLGAAFAATAAGTAAAAPSVDGAGVTKVLGGLPVAQAAKTVTGVTRTQPGDDGVQGNLNQKGNSLLGGFPTNVVTKGLHLGG